MSTLISVIALLAAIVAGAGSWWLLGQCRAFRAEADALRARIDLLGTLEPDDPAGLTAAGGPGSRLVLVDILNPLELATSQTKAAGMLHKLRPSLLQRIVYDEAARQIRERLVEEGVVADVRVHVAR